MSSADRVIAKPFEPTGLVATVRRCARDASCRFDGVSVAAVRSPAEYEAELQRYLFERSEEGRAVRVGEKEVSEQAAIVARYAGLFSREQVDALREQEQAHIASDVERERLYRLRKTCEAGIVSAELAEREDALENAILGGARRVGGRGAAAARGAGEARRPRRLRRARPARRAPGLPLGRVQRRASRAAPRRRGARGRGLGRARPGRAERGGEADLAARARARARGCERSRHRLLDATCARAGSSACSVPSATTFRPLRTSRGSGGSRRSSRRTRRSARSRSAWTRCSDSASTSRTTRTSGSTWKTARRSRRGRA